ncbi:MAG: hypothetical protein BWY89_01766 [Bacteroidetes bacterium ADurb.BinA012]|nr:MAG: hypothetical protein BWY89_01766 [Bacteroidetes bacterium ADurb.BinA012]
MLRCCIDGSRSGMGMILLSDWVKTYAMPDIAAVWMTMKSDHPYRNEKKRP